MGAVWETIKRYDADSGTFVSCLGKAVGVGDRIRFEHGAVPEEVTVTEVVSQNPAKGERGAIHADLGDGLLLILTPHE